MKSVMNLITGGFPSQGPVARSVDVFVDRRLDKRLSERSRRRWLKTPSLSLWHHKVDDKYRQLSKVVSTYLLNLTPSAILSILVFARPGAPVVTGKTCYECAIYSYMIIVEMVYWLPSIGMAQIVRPYLVHGAWNLLYMDWTKSYWCYYCWEVFQISTNCKTFFFIIFYSFHKLIQRQSHLLVCKLSYSKGT